jgi:hypothetical protein
MAEGNLGVIDHSWKKGGVKVFGVGVFAWPNKHPSLKNAFSLF